MHGKGVSGSGITLAAVRAAGGAKIRVCQGDSEMTISRRGGAAYKEGLRVVFLLAGASNGHDGQRVKYPARIPVVVQ